jgi:Domain of Unknown Function (DUF1080)
MRILKRSIYVFAMVLLFLQARAQDGIVKRTSAEPLKIPLTDMAAFKPQAGNWQIVGSVSMDPDIDIHQPPAVPVAKTGKNKKNTKIHAVVPPRTPVTVGGGTGILVNLTSADNKDNLISTFEHGDIELELEVMIPKGSNSGIYLQGRYEVQLLDSWGVKDPKYSDIGGIYRNWETEKGKIYMGKAPLTNPAKAPGLWQKFKISFRAPKFDPQGNKISNARFLSVELNGVKIHDNVEVPLPTGGPLASQETAMGPLMIQGDHGPVAFRNIQYRLMKDLACSISDISYKIYHGDFKVFGDFIASKPVATGSSPELTCEVLDVDNAYGIVYTATLTVPEDASYDFTLLYTGGSKLTVDGQEVINVIGFDAGGRSGGSIQLKAGKHALEIDNYKGAPWLAPRLGLKIQTAASYPQTLNAFNSYPPDDSPVSSILIKAGSEPKLLRAFVDYKQDRSRRLTHTIGVADPAGINFVYDLEAGNLVCVWRGDFVDATPMWHDRGDGSFHPLGAVQYLMMNQPLAFLSSSSEAFPTAGQERDFKTLGYSIDEATRRPIFNYSYHGLEVEDKVYPDDHDRSITHEVTLKDRGTKTGLHYKLAEGSAIEKMENGTYVIDDSQYYIKVLSTTQPVIRDVAGKKELILPVEGNTLKYSIIW